MFIQLYVIAKFIVSSSETMVLANPDVVNEFFKLSSSQAFKSIAMQLDTMHLECHHRTLNTMEWKGELILVKYMKVFI